MTFAKQVLFLKQEIADRWVKVNDKSRFLVLRQMAVNAASSSSSSSSVAV